MTSRIAISDVILASCEEEQAWNRQVLNETVSAPVLRLWRYDRPSLVLGCSQRNAVTPSQVDERAGIPATVRQAGGGAVLAGPWMLSASVALPNAHPLVTRNLVESYRWIGELYAQVLRNAGIAAHALPAEEASALQQRSLDAGLGWACFGGFSPWEVVAGGRKIVGLAQVRKRTGALFVAGLLVENPDWPLLCQAMDKPPTYTAGLRAATTSCAEELGRALSPDEFATPLFRTLLEAIAP